MGFYAPAQLVRDAREHGVTVSGIDVNASSWECTLETGSGQSPSKQSPSKVLRLGLLMIRGLPTNVGHKIVEARSAGGPFRDLADFTRRTRLGQAMITRLADAGALSSLTGDRRAAYWQSLAQDKASKELSLFEATGADNDDALPEFLQPMEEVDEVYADYETTGLSLRAHPVSFVRPQLDRLRVTSASQLQQTSDGKFVRVAGVVLLRQRPSTAKGITFVTLEDETGAMNLVLKPEIWQRHYKVARRSNAWLANGVLENREGVIHIVVGRIDDLTEQVAGLVLKSRDFH
jgi:error-prone DNA polymerase